MATGSRFLFLRRSSATFRERLIVGSPIELESAPVRVVPAAILRTFDNSREFVPERGIEKLSSGIALRCEYGEGVSADEVGYTLETVGLALQLVKPTSRYLQYWVDVNMNLTITSVASQVGKLGATHVGEDNYLTYQEDHLIDAEDIERANRILPLLSRAREKGPGSWRHPYLSVHRAVVFFGQGYGVNLGVLRQFLWAAGLDSLFSSKRDYRLRGARSNAGRLRKFLGSDFRPFGQVQIPNSQECRRDLRLIDIGEDIFWLRNALAHGLELDDDWLSGPGEARESGYAYQLAECTEILLREVLIRILKDEDLFAVFCDSEKLDDYFAADS